MTAPQLKKYLDAANAVASADPPARATPRKHSLWSLLRPFLIATVMVCLAAATAPVLQRLREAYPFLVANGLVTPEEHLQQQEAAAAAEQALADTDWE